MKKSKLFFCFALLAMVSMLSFAGASKESSDSMGPVTISVLNYVDVTAPEGRTWAAIKASFETAYPNIKLEVTNLYDEAYHQKLAALAASNTLPDVMYLWPGGRSAQVTANGLAADLYPYLGAGKDNFVSAAVAPQGDGKLYELPVAVTATHVMFANMKVLNELGLSIPKTYAELKAMVPKIKAAGKTPVLMANKAAWVMESCLYSAILGRVAGDKWFMDAVKGKGAKFTDPQFVKSLDVVKMLYADGVLDEATLQMDYGQVPGMFANGESPFLIDGDWRVGALVELFDEAAQKDIKMITFPKIDGEKDLSTSIVPATGFGMNAKISGAKAQAAWKFISFYSGPAASLIRLVDSGMIPAYKIDYTDVPLSPLAKERSDFYKKYSGTAVVDNVLAGEQNGTLTTGLQEIGLGLTTPADLAAAVEKSVSDIR
jgi:raffinose/stachyose/melibiose transport system substrate-binding protein